MDEKQKQEIKDFLKSRFPEGIQAFTTRNWVGDYMENIYFKNGVVIDECSGYGYIEIFGIEDSFYKELEDEGYIH